MDNSIIGIDIGGTNTRIGIVNKNGEILAQGNIETANFPNVTDFIHASTTEIERLLGLSNTSALGIGIGAPNGNFYTGSIEFAPNLLWKGKIPLAKLFQQQFKIPTLLTNDANAAAIGEMKFGAAKNIKDFLFITLGTGVGSGIVVNENLVYGHDGFAGEIGHVIVIPNGRTCGCGRKGCLEMYASVRGICITMKELMEKHNENGLLPSDFTSKDIYNLATQGNFLATEAFKITGDILGLALANSVAYTSPSHIFVFGGLTNAWEFLYPPMYQSFEDNLLSIYKNKIPIKQSGLKEADAAIMGAAALILDSMKTKNQ
jgi:glucokinase